MISTPVRLKCASPALAMAVAALISPTDSATRGEGVSTRVAYSITTTNTGVKALRIWTKETVR